MTLLTRRTAFALIAATASSLASGAEASAAGVRLLNVPAAEGVVALDGAIWTPCDAPSEKIALAKTQAHGVLECPIAGTRKLPLVIVSHGGRGWYGGHHDTAAALADHGFVVAAVTHPDDTLARQWQIGRPRAVKRLIDFMLHEWSEKRRLNPERIGFFGFSRGGYTGLVVIGGKPDFRRFVSHCRDVPDDPLCRQAKRRRPDDTSDASDDAARRRRAPPPADAYVSDARIAAAVIAAPLGVVFSKEGLQNVAVPIQIWRAENDQLSTYPYNAEAVFRALPDDDRAEIRVVKRAGHFAFLAPCSQRQTQIAPRLCDDDHGFNRKAFHTEFNNEVVKFFKKHIGDES